MVGGVAHAMAQAKLWHVPKSRYNACMDNRAKPEQASEVVTTQGPATRALRNGSLQDVETGKIVQSSLTTDEARELAKLRWEKHRRAWEDGAMDGTGASTPEGATRVIAKAVASTAKDTGSRQQIQAAKLYVEQLRGDSQQEGDAIEATLRIPREVMPMLIEALRLAREMRAGAP